jgi:hypothetical protein
MRFKVYGPEVGNDLLKLYAEADTLEEAVVKMATVYTLEDEGWYIYDKKVVKWYTPDGTHIPEYNGWQHADMD